MFGFTQRIGDDCFNAAVLVDPVGAVVGTYHKIQLQSHELMYAPGQGLPVFETSLGTLGIMICADRRWPETGRALRLAGAELLLTPSYGMWDDTNEALMRTRSFENNIEVCFVHPNVAFVTDAQGGVPARVVSTCLACSCARRATPPAGRITPPERAAPRAVRSPDALAREWGLNPLGVGTMTHVCRGGET